MSRSRVSNGINVSNSPAVNTRWSIAPTLSNSARTCAVSVRSTACPREPGGRVLRACSPLTLLLDTTVTKAPLFVRDKRATELTPAGAQLLAEARPLLANAAALRRRVTRVARGPATFVVGFMPGLIVTAPIRALVSRHPELTVEVIRTTWADQTDVIHDGRADVSFVRLPIDQQGLTIQQLHTEARV